MTIFLGGFSRAHFSEGQLCMRQFTRKSNFPLVKVSKEKFFGGNYLLDNSPRDNYPGSNCPGVILEEIFQGAIIQEAISQEAISWDNCPGVDYPGAIFLGGNCPDTLCDIKLFTMK